MIICVDFDGTVVDHQFPEIGKPVPGAIKWMKKFNKYGAKLILWTMRSDSRLFKTALSDAKKYLAEEGIELYAVNENPLQKSWTDSPKVHGNVYIDDSAFGCPLIFPKGFHRPCVDWEAVGPEIERMLLSHA